MSRLWGIHPMYSRRPRFADLNAYLTSMLEKQEAGKGLGRSAFYTWLTSTLGGTCLRIMLLGAAGLAVVVLAGLFLSLRTRV